MERRTRPLVFLHDDIGAFLKEASGIYAHLLEDTGTYEAKLRRLSDLFDEADRAVAFLLKAECRDKEGADSPEIDGPQEPAEEQKEAEPDPPEPGSNPILKRIVPPLSSGEMRKQRSEELSGMVLGILRDSPHTTAEVRDHLKSTYQTDLTLSQVAGRLRHLRGTGKIVRSEDPESRLDKWRIA